MASIEGRVQYVAVEEPDLEDVSPLRQIRVPTINALIAMSKLLSLP